MGLLVPSKDLESKHTSYTTAADSSNAKIELSEPVDIPQEIPNAVAAVFEQESYTDQKSSGETVIEYDLGVDSCLPCSFEVRKRQYRTQLMTQCSQDSQEAAPAAS